jgi:hypothetical protein
LDNSFKIDLDDYDTDDSDTDDVNTFREHLTTSFIQELEYYGEKKLAKKLSDHLNKNTKNNKKCANWFRNKMIEGLTKKAD